MRGGSAWALCAIGSLLWLSVGCRSSECDTVFCGPCEPPLTLRVFDAETGERIRDVTFEGAEGSCGPVDGETWCTAGERTGRGDYELEVSSPGYMPAMVTQHVGADTEGGCCSCGYEPVMLDVPLDPL